MRGQQSRAASAAASSSASLQAVAYMMPLPCTARNACVSGSVFCGCMYVKLLYSGTCLRWNWEVLLFDKICNMCFYCVTNWENDNNNNGIILLEILYFFPMRDREIVIVQIVLIFKSKQINWMSFKNVQVNAEQMQFEIEACSNWHWDLWFVLVYLFYSERSRGVWLTCKFAFARPMLTYWVIIFS